MGPAVVESVSLAWSLRVPADKVLVLSLTARVTLVYWVVGSKGVLAPGEAAPLAYHQGAQ
jgi:hypothetical protein